MPLTPTTPPAQTPPLVWTRSHLGELSAANRVVVDAAAQLIKAGARTTLMPALQAWPPTHVVELFVHLPLKRARVLFRWLDPEQARVIAELDDTFRDVLLADATVERLVHVIDALEPEEAAAARRRPHTRHKAARWCGRWRGSPRWSGPPSNPAVRPRTWGS